MGVSQMSLIELLDGVHLTVSGSWSVRTMEPVRIETYHHTLLLIMHCIVVFCQGTDCYTIYCFIKYVSNTKTYQSTRICHWLLFYCSI